MENTCLIRHVNNVYKVRVTSDALDSIRLNNNLFETIEPVFRAILYAEERGWFPSVVDTDAVTVHCFKKLWKASEKIVFTQHGKVLKAYPYMFIFHVRENGKQEAAQSRRSRDVQRDEEDFGQKQVTEDGDHAVMESSDTLLMTQTNNHSGDAESVVLLTKLNAEKRKLINDIPEQGSAKCESRNKRPKMSHNVSKPRKSRSCRTKRSLSSKACAKVETQSSSSPQLCSVRSESHVQIQRPQMQETKIEARSRYPRAENSIENARIDSKSRTPVFERTLPVLPRRRDRHAVEREQIAEDMKLQTLARPTSVSPPIQAEQSISGLWKLVETILTPVRYLTNRRRK